MTVLKAALCADVKLPLAWYISTVAINRAVNKAVPSHLYNKWSGRVIFGVLWTVSAVMGSKHSAHIDGGPRTYMCEAATELDIGDMEYARLLPNAPTQPCYTTVP